MCVSCLGTVFPPLETLYYYHIFISKDGGDLVMDKSKVCQLKSVSNMPFLASLLVLNDGRILLFY